MEVRSKSMLRRVGSIILSNLVFLHCWAQPFDTAGKSEMLPVEAPDRWVFIGDSLVDVVENVFLGVVGTADGRGGYWISPDQKHLYAVESFRARGNRGERTEIVSIVDTATLGVIDEVVIPPKVAPMSAINGSTALSDDGRFFAVFNLTPATSLSVVDVEQREFAGEISTPGCSLAYPAGDRRYLMICANGDLLTVAIDDSGHEVSKARLPGVFDPRVDPITEGGVRFGDRWLFVSFEGMVHTLDVSHEPVREEATWSLLSAEDRQDNWRVAGRQHLAVHQPTGRLYSLMRQSEQALDDPADMDGTEIWVYDLATQTRVQRFPAVPPSDEPRSAGPRTIGATSGDGAAGILVTQGTPPLLITSGSGISVRYALTGAYVHESLKNVPPGGRLTLRAR